MAAWLLTAQTAIEQAKSLVPANPGMRDPLNRIIAAYNAAESSYLVFHQAFIQGAMPDATALTVEITQLLQSVTSLVNLYGGGKA